MAYENESIGVAPWKPEYGTRVFKQDAFLSYRRPDMAAVKRLANLLETVGVALWWDENGDEEFTDGRLIEKIGHGIFHSRYLVVCVSSTSEPSEWMRAEFVLNIAAGKKWNYGRVVVVLLDEAASVPNELATCPAYHAREDEASSLAEVLRAGNRFDFNPKEVRDSVWERFLEPPPMRSPARDPNEKVSNIELLLGASWKIDDPDSDDFCQSLMSVRCSVDRLDRGAIESVPGLSSMVLNACFRPALRKNKENRANAIGAIARLAELGNREAEKNLSLFLSQERSAEVISMAFGWILGHLHELDGDDRAVALLAIASAPNEAARWGNDPSLSHLPEAVRCRVFTGRDLDASALSPKERLAIATRCINSLLLQPESGENRMRIQWELSRLKEAAFSFYDNAPHPKVVNPELVSPAFDLLERLIAQSERLQGFPLTAIELPFDLLLAPLAMCFADGQNPERAEKIFDRACRVLLASGAKTENMVSAYRSFLTDIEQGITFDAAKVRVDEAIYQASRRDELAEREKRLKRLQAEGFFK